MPTRFVISIVCFIALVTAVAGQPLLTEFQRLTAEHGLSDARTKFVVKDRDGYIWIATDNGLNRFDGASVKSYVRIIGDSTSLLDNYMMNLAVYGNVLVASNRRGISFLKHGQHAFTNFPLDRVPGVTVGASVFAALSLDPDSNLWLGTDGYGVLVIRKAQIDSFLAYGKLDYKQLLLLDVVQNESDKSYNSITDAKFDRYGNAWLATYGGLVRFDRKKTLAQRKIVSAYRPAFIVPFVLTYDGGDNLYVVPRNGHALGKLTDIGREPRFVDFSKKMIDVQGGSTNRINGANIDRSGNVWVAIEKKGFAVGKPVGDDLIFQNLLPGNRKLHNVFVPEYIEGFYFDDQDNVWISTTRGVAYTNLGASAFRNEIITNASRQRFGESTTALVRVGDNVWLGAEENGVHLLKPDDNELVQSSSTSGDFGLVYCLAFDEKRNRVWAGTEMTLLSGDANNGNLAQLQPTSVYVDTGWQKRIGVIITMERDARTDKLWIGTGRGLFQLDPETLHATKINLHNVNDAIPAILIVRDIMIDRNRSINLVTDQGFIQYDPTKQTARYFPNPNGNGNEEVRFTALLEEADGNFWIGTFSEGLYAFNAGTGLFTALPVPLFGQHYSVASLIRDGNGKIWMATNRGIFHVTRDRVQCYDALNAYNKCEFNFNAVTAYENKLLFGHSRGVAAFDPNDARDVAYAAPLRITDFSVSDRSVFAGFGSSLGDALLRGHNLLLSPRENFFSFEYALLDYTKAPFAVYEYMLEGLDVGWVHAGKRRFANYTHVPPGDYTFKVRASDDGIVWTQSRPISISVKPAFTQTPWFYFLLGGLLVGIVTLYAILYLREHNERREKELAEEKARTKEMFLANMSHEIRTPLNAILGINKLLLEKQPRDDQRQFLRAVQQSSEHLKAIINDILDFSKIDIGKVTLEQIPFSMQDVMQTVHAALQVKADEKGLNFNCQPDEHMPTHFYGDPVRLTQVLMNLGSNAIKFTEQGHVTISCRTLQKSDTAATLAFVVEDTGIGIAQTEQERIFESFTQAASDTTRKYGGTGLGLAISKRLIELMKGSLELKSVVDQGSVFTFRVSLPLAEAALEAQHAAVTNPSVLRNTRVLLVEDNAFNQLVAVESLKHRVPGIVIDVADNGVEGLQKLAAQKYGVVLMDVIMPELDGYETTRRLRASDGVNRDVFVIAMTANIYKHDIDKCYASGMNDVVKKPFEIDELLEKITAAVQPAALQASGSATVNG